MDNNGVKLIYHNRFRNKNKNNIWEILCKYYFQKFIPTDSVVCDVGAGKCEFINNINCKKKIAYDLNQDTNMFANKDVIVVNKDFDNIKEIDHKDINIFFLSNFLEHLNSKESIIELFRQFSIIHENVKSKNKKIIILQPNIKYVGAAYWDFIDHKLPLTEKAIIEVGEMFGYKCEYMLKKFLPYTTKSKFPQFSFLIYLYIKLLPFSGFIFGKQSFIVLEK